MKEWWKLCWIMLKIDVAKTFVIYLIFQCILWGYTYKLSVYQAYNIDCMIIWYIESIYHVLEVYDRCTSEESLKWWYLKAGRWLISGLFSNVDCFVTIHFQHSIRSSFVDDVWSTTFRVNTIFLKELTTNYSPAYI